ncbi:HAUS augmin-like complex subunit 8 isoform X3 [Callithrix jacchus]
MADSLGRGAGKPATGPTNPGSAKKKEKRVQGGRVVESRYLQYEKKTAQKAPAGDGSQTRGKTSEGGRKPSLLQKSKADSSGVAKGDLQSTLLEGHGTAPPDLDLSAINDKSVIRKTPQLAKTIPKKPDSTSFSAPRKKSPDLSEAMEMMESQTLLLTLLAVKMENNLAEFERRAEKNLLIMCKEKEKLQKTAHELKRRLLLSQRKRELADVLDAQVQMLSPFEAVAKRFREQYRTFATALDTTRHELPVRSIHLEGDGQQLLDALERELRTTQRLLGELDVGNSEENVQVLDLLSELKDVTVKRDLELRSDKFTKQMLFGPAYVKDKLIQQPVRVYKRLKTNKNAHSTRNKGRNPISCVQRANSSAVRRIHIGYCFTML